MAKGTLFGKPKGDVIKRPGAFKKKAQAAGQSTSDFIQQVMAPGSRADTRTKRQAALAKTMMSWHNPYKQ